MGLLSLSVVLLAVLVFVYGWHTLQPPPPRPLTEGDIATSYIANTDWGSATLVLHPDHTFDEVVTPKDQTAMDPALFRENHAPSQLHGTWQVKLTDGTAGASGVVTLTPFVAIHHDGTVLTAGAVPTITRLPGGGIEIAADPDFGIVFESK